MTNLADDVRPPSTPGADPGTASTDEEFNCTHLQERNVRFSSPGFVNANRVGLFYKFVGVPTGRTLLEVFWDEENAPSARQRIDLGDGEIQRDDDSRTDYTGVLEHVYMGITEETDRRVRANLISDGRTGNCATVRDVTIGPGSSSGAPPAACVPGGTGSFGAGNTQMGRVFRDAIPSSCGGKAYPGIFNPGTSYFYEVFTFTAQGAGPVCVRVDFDPNPSGNLATDCDTNAHASAYSGTYNPASQSTGFLGDVGSSITQSFQFTVPGGSNFQVVVTNTAAQEMCDYEFTVQNVNCF